MAVDLKSLTLLNSERWQKMHVLPQAIAFCGVVALRLERSKELYAAVSAETGVPWWIIAVIHERESGQNWTRSLAQGDRWDRVSVHEPARRGPFRSWEAAAIDALTNCPPFLSKWNDWSIAGALTRLEEYNGLGYAAGPHDKPSDRYYPPQPSPYLWANTDQYKSGKYIADHHFDPNAVDKQLGCAAIISFFSEFKKASGISLGSKLQES